MIGQNKKPKLDVAVAGLLFFLSMCILSSTAAAPPSLTTIKDVEVKAEAVRLRLIVTLTHAVSYRVTQPEPDRLSIDLERADFDFEHPVDLASEGGWITDWGYGYLMLGYTRLSVHFDRQVSVEHDEMQPETPIHPAELLIDLVEAP
jgi:hypothetical protein